MNITKIGDNAKRKIVAVNTPGGCYFPAGKRGGFEFKDCLRGTVFLRLSGEVEVGQRTLDEAAKEHPYGVIYEGDSLRLDF